MAELDHRLLAEIDSFQEIWRGGFFVADPLDPLAPRWLESMTGHYHVIYLACIRQWVGPDSNVLEIGCGRGAWTRSLLGAKEVTCVDVLSAEHNGFWNYIGPADNVRYHQVEDFELSMLDSHSIDYVFSYDALCHVSFAGISRYVRSLRRVMRPGAVGFLMVADYRKYNAFVEAPGRHNALLALLPKHRYPAIRRLGGALVKGYSTWHARRLGIQSKRLDEDDTPIPGRWYHAGAEETSNILRTAGFTVVDEDMSVDPRSPVIHFVL